MLPHSIYAKNEYGKILAKVEFPEIRPGFYDIDNVYVAGDDNLVEESGKLLKMAVDLIKEKGGRITSSDTYIGRWLEDHHVI